MIAREEYMTNNNDDYTLQVYAEGIREATDQKDHAQALYLAALAVGHTYRYLIDDAKVLMRIRDTEGRLPNYTAQFQNKLLNKIMRAGREKHGDGWDIIEQAL